MEDLLLTNLAKSQAFDKTLRAGTGIDKLTLRFTRQIMFNPDSKSRSTAINRLEKEIVQHFNDVVQPAARQLGIVNAKTVLDALPSDLRKEGLASAELRRQILVDGNFRPQDRLRIVQALVKDNANTLENRLLAHWLEPGLNTDQKLKLLTEVHERQVAAQAKYSQDLQKFYRGEGPRPRKPQLDYLARFQSESKTDLRAQARRAGTDAETQTFVQRGFITLTWVTVNASAACPDCKSRQGMTAKANEWDKIGKPGAGKTVCQQNCFCMLVPAQTVEAHPQLKDGLEVPPAPEKGTPEAKTTRAQAAAPKKKAPPPFPESSQIGKLKEVRALGGSTGAKLVQDEHGQQFVFKKGSSPDHLREEFAAESAYRAAGVRVPDSKLYETGDGPVKLSKFIEGRTLNQLSPTSTEFKKAAKDVREGFATDAVLGNWDVAGTGLDNVLVGNDGKAYRIDAGGALRFRAQGRPKGDAFGVHPVELWTLRDPAVNSDSAKLFGELKHDQMMSQAQSLLSKRDAVLNALPKDLSDLVQKRFDGLSSLVKTDQTLTADKWVESYRDKFAEMRTKLGADGILDKMPKQLTQVAGDKVKVVDENGKEFDDLRGPNSLAAKLEAFVNANGGKYSIISNYAGAQAGTSWSSPSMAMKAFFVSQRDMPTNSYFWKGGFDASKKMLEQATSTAGAGAMEQLKSTVAAQHAFTYELLSRVEMPQSDRVAGVVDLVRTEDKAVMDLHGLKRGQTRVQVQRGALESTSIFQRTSVRGKEDTIQRVPFHRVFATYLQSKGGTHERMFLGDSENEFVAMLEGLSLDYVKSDR